MFRHFNENTKYNVDQLKGIALALKADIVALELAAKAFQAKSDGKFCCSACEDIYNKKQNEIKQCKTEQVLLGRQL